MPVTSASPFTLPDPSTVESVFKALSNAHDTVEEFIWQINRVTACEAVVIEEDKVDELAPDHVRRDRRRRIRPRRPRYGPQGTGRVQRAPPRRDSHPRRDPFRAGTTRESRRRRWLRASASV